MFYDYGVKVALDRVGLAEKVLNFLRGPGGEIATRIPVGMAVGALSGAGTGALADKPGKGALLGAATGGLGGLSVGLAPLIRRKALARLAKVVGK